LPSQLRRLLRAQGRDLHAEFVRLLPEPPRPIAIQRWSVRRVGLVAGAAALAALIVGAAASTNNNIATKTTLGIHQLGCAQPAPLWLEAQSVPAASLVPCLHAMPPGWTLADVAVNDGRSILTLNNDRSGVGAMVVRLAGACDPAGATPVPSPQAGVRRYERVERLSPRFGATQFDVFAGGCVTTRLAAPAAHRAELTSETQLILGFVSRATLRQALEVRSAGRLHLDPEGAEGP
jgi:hypothetical protein